jgi:hypothetical protein
MALALTPAEIDAALEKGGSELKFLLERNKVDTELQAMLYHSEITTMGVFVTFVKDSDELKQVVKDSFGIDGSANLGNRVRVANLLVAFQLAQGRVTEQSKLEGELSAKHIIKPMTTSEYSSMKVAWERRYWPLEDEQIPGRSYLERRADELEQEDFRSEPLTTVLSKEQDDPDVLVPVWSSTGALQMKKGAQQVEEPKNPEALRKRLKLLGLGLMFLGIRHSNRPYLQGLTPQLFEDYLTYLLSEHCYYLQGKSAEGYNISGPSWAQLLIYELQVRKKAWWLVQSGGTPFADALRAAWKDPVVKERYLTTPVALAGVPFKRSVESDSGSSAKRSKGAKGKGRGKPSKGRGKGKGTKSVTDRLGISMTTPDGDGICFGYNDFATRCRDRNCRFKHVCGACFGKHPVYACRPNNRAETQGSNPTP